MHYLLFRNLKLKIKKVKDKPKYDFKTIDLNITLLAKWLHLLDLDYDGYDEKTGKIDRMPAKNISDVKYHIEKTKSDFSSKMAKDFISLNKKCLKHHDLSTLFKLTRKNTKDIGRRCCLPWLKI